MELDTLLDEIKIVDGSDEVDINELLDIYMELDGGERKYFVDGLNDINKDEFTKLMEGGLI